MKTIYLDGRRLQRTPEGYTYIQELFHFPDHFGKNMDALYDLLTELCEEVNVEINHSDEMDMMIKKVVLNAQDENNSLNICLTK